VLGDWWSTSTTRTTSSVFAHATGSAQLWRRPSIGAGLRADSWDRTPAMTRSLFVVAERSSGSKVARELRNARRLYHENCAGNPQ